MKACIKKKVEERNDRIIKAIIKKAENVCKRKSQKLLLMGHMKKFILIGRIKCIMLLIKMMSIYHL